VKLPESAIFRCRTAYLGGHIERCDHCQAETIAYNCCRNRHCPKCQCLTKERWLAARKAELLPTRYFHAVFTALVIQVTMQNGSSETIGYAFWDLSSAPS
jgi:hypothetical protein